MHAEDLVIKPLAALAALTIVFAAGIAPASARDSYVIDNAKLLSAGTVSSINAKVGDFYAQAHKEVLVVIEPQVTAPPGEAAEQLFAQQRVNGVLIFIAMKPKTIGIIPGYAAERYFPAGTTAAIRQAIASAFNSGDYNGGVTNGVDLTLSEYRSHLNALRTVPVNTMAAPAIENQTLPAGGFNMSLIWWLIALAVIFFIVRGIFRAMAGPRMMPPGYGGGGPVGAMAPATGTAAVAAAASGAACSAASAVRFSATSSSAATVRRSSSRIRAWTPAWAAATSVTTRAAATRAASRTMRAKPTWATPVSAAGAAAIRAAAAGVIPVAVAAAISVAAAATRAAAAGSSRSRLDR
jgi:uncharacterized membrane protein YgcG